MMTNTRSFPWLDLTAKPVQCFVCMSMHFNGFPLCTFCQKCAGSHSPADPCPAQKPFFQFNMPTTGRTPCGAPEETDNDHILKVKTWHCPDCNTDNDEDKFPIKCSICRRGRP